MTREEAVRRANKLYSDLCFIAPEQSKLAVEKIADAIENAILDDFNDLVKRIPAVREAIMDAAAQQFDRKFGDEKLTP